MEKKVGRALCSANSSKLLYPCYGGTQSSESGKKRVRQIPRNFREVDTMFAIAFYIENLLMASLPRAENAKYVTGAGGF